MLPPTQNAQGKFCRLQKAYFCRLEKKDWHFPKRNGRSAGEVSKAMDQKERFEKESRGQSVLAETTSANVIDQMF